MKIFCAGLSTETNTFSPIPTGIDDFSVTRPGDPAGDFSLPLDLLDHLEEAGDQIVLGNSAFAQPGGVTTRSAYECLLGEILDQIEAAGELDAIFLMLHGAMVVDGIEDTEVDILEHVREKVGESVIVGVLLDLHCHLDHRLLNLVDVIVTYKEYPHIDIAERGIEVVEMLRAKLEGKTKPVMALFDCKIIGLCPTQVEPMRSFVNLMQKEEKKSGVLSLSLIHGFPYGDVAHAGAKMLVITDNRKDLAESTAEHFGNGFHQLRHKVLLHPLEIDEALNRAVRSTARPVVVADQSDNAGGGAPSDSTFALDWLLRKGVQRVGVAIIYDPEVVKTVRIAGTGARLPIRLGGKTGPVSGKPLDVIAEVIAVRDDYMHEFPQAADRKPIPISLGCTVCLKIEGIFVIVSSRRSQCFTPKIWEDFGVPITSLDIIIPKSINHFMSGHGSIAGEVIHMSTDGALPGDMTKIPYQKLKTSDKYPWNERFPVGKSH